MRAAQRRKSRSAGPSPVSPLDGTPPTHVGRTSTEVAGARPRIDDEKGTPPEWSGGARSRGEAPKTRPTTTQQEFSIPVPTLASGYYTVTWRAVGADTHVVSGEINFSVGAS